MKRKMQMYNLRAYLTLPNWGFLIVSFMIIWGCAWLIYTYSVKAEAHDVVVNETLPILSKLFSETYRLDRLIGDPEELLQKTSDYTNILDFKFLSYSGKGLNDILLKLPIQTEEGDLDYGVYSINPTTGRFECEQGSNCSKGQDEAQKEFDYVQLKDLLNYIKDDVKDTIEKVVLGSVLPIFKGMFVDKISETFADGRNVLVVMESKTPNKVCKNSSSDKVKYSSKGLLKSGGRSDPEVKKWTTKSPKWNLLSQPITPNNTEGRYETGCIKIDGESTLSLWFSLHYPVEPPTYILKSGYGRIIFIIWVLFITMYLVILKQGRKDITALVRYTKSLETQKERQKSNIPKRIKNRPGLRKLGDSIWKLRLSLVSKDQFAETIGIVSHAMLKPSRKVYMRAEKLKAKYFEMSTEKRDRYFDSLLNDSYGLFKLQEKTLFLSDVLRKEKLNDFSEVNMYDLLNKTINDKQEELKEKGISVDNALLLDLVLKADLDLVGTILDLALDNAIKYNKSGGNITIEQKVSANNTLDILIKNSGIEMSKVIKEFYNRIFLGHSPSSPNLVTNKGSHGLGLKTIYEIMRLHFGKVSIHSSDEIYTGTVLKLTFPAAGYLAPEQTSTTSIKKTEEKAADEDKVSGNKALGPEEILDLELFNIPKDEGMRSMITTSGIGYVALSALIYLFISGHLF